MTQIDKKELNDLMVSVVAKTVSMYPNSKESINELKTMLKDHIESENDELIDLKRTIRNFFLANVGILLLAGIWIGTIQTRQLRNMEDIKENKAVTVQQNEKIARNDIASAQIQTKLSAIEVTLLEIRQSLRIR